ncbi:MAG: phage tail tube protein [Methylocystis sp.]|uniref:phage tail tube protein n=1 Tax=Methylocystis sp. TaxID=1911079 RepID=UPI003D11231F
MSTGSIALGQVARLAFKDESGAYGTPASGNYQYGFYYKSSLRETKPIEADPIIGAGYNNFRDATPPAPALSEHGGSLELPVCLNQIGDWLKLLFGAPQTSGSTNFVHVFSSGALTLPTRTIELNPIAGDFRQHVSCAARNFSFDSADANGYQRASMDLLGYGENLLGSSGAGTPTAARAYDPVKATGGAVLLGGVAVGVLLSAKFMYETGLSQDRYVDGLAKFGASILSEQASLTGELRVRYTSAAFDTAAVNETDQSLEFNFVKSANNSLTFLAPAARLGRAGVAIEGPGGIEQTIPFRCAQTAGAPMLTATLKNQIASY